MPSLNENDETTTAPLPNPARQEILNCAFSSWYEQYRSYVPKTRVLKPVPQEFIDYLLADGLHLPADDPGVEWDGSDNGSDWSDDDDAEQVRDPTEDFKEFHQQINDTIKELGAVAPKLNWSAPRDATWISTTSNMKCTSASDLYMLLKSSSYITHDLTEAFDSCRDTCSYDGVQFELVLRKWVEINPSVEFRCFVNQRELVGVTQRDMNYYDFLDAQKEELRDLIEHFFDTVLRETFANDSFVFDVYIPKPFDRVWLVDINPWATKTDTKLFAWEQLAAVTPSPTVEYDFRLVDKQDSSRGFGSIEHTESAVPKDFVDASVSGEITELARQLQSHLHAQQQEDSD